MIRKIIAIVVGLVVAIFLVWVIQRLGHSLYPPPQGLDFADPEQLKNYIQSLPVGAFLIVIAAYAVGAYTGGLTACLIARDKPLMLAAIIGAFVLAGTLLNVMTIPHPAWFTIAAVLSIIAAAWLASLRFGAK